MRLLLTVLVFAFSFQAFAEVAKKTPFKILVLSPGLSFNGMNDATNPVKLLEKFLNRRCANCFVVIDGSKPDIFVASLAMNIESELAQLNPDLVVYYESGVFLSAEIFDSFLNRIDDDTGKIRAATTEELEGKFCCNRFLNFLPSEYSHQFKTVLNYVDTYKQARLQYAGALSYSADEAMKSFSYLYHLSKGKFILLVSPYGYRADSLAFENSISQNLLFKFLIYFYMPTKTPLAKVYVDQGFPAVAVYDFKELYQPANLMYRHPYRLNSNGAEKWAKIAGRTLLKYMRAKEMIPHEHK